MLTPEQEKWINHLPDDNRIEIFPYDPDSPEKFEMVKRKIRAEMGSGLRIEHRGASSLGISGQRELDVYIPVSGGSFDGMLTGLEKLFGKPGSVYPGNRARFVTYAGATKAEVFLINEAGKGWLDCLKFEGYLKAHSEALEAYRKLKENGRGLSTREYYRMKNEFINEILGKASC